MWDCDRLHKKKILDFKKKKNDENRCFLTLKAMIDDCIFILINLYNPNIEKEEVSTLKKNESNARNI